MLLYNLSILRATGITHVCSGSFSGTNSQEILISHGKSLELLRLDPNTGKVYPLLTTEVFSVIRSLVSFRASGTSKDYTVVGSDSGRIVILEYIPAKNILEKVHQETFGRSGCQRIDPGQYLAMDPKGRAVMIGAIENQKLVYILNRDNETRLIISSPLEAHKTNTLTYHMIGLDVGFENPVFACLKIDYEKMYSDPTAPSSKQNLALYELDLGLNQVDQKYSEQLEEHANFLISVPGGNDGPSGVLICSENHLTYKNLGHQPDIRCSIPRRLNDLAANPERDMIFICLATYRTQSLWHFLVQTEQGDIFKVTLQTDDKIVSEIRLKYFDTVPPATAMCVMEMGFLFVAADFGNHYLYRIAEVVDDEPRFSSAMLLEDRNTFFFAPRALKNLVMLDELHSYAPILGCHVSDLANEDAPQVYLLCGRGSRSSVRVLRHGLNVSEMAVSELPGTPKAIWTVKKKVDDKFHAYIVVSFVTVTLVLSIGDTVEEVTDSGFLGAVPTLCCWLVEGDGFVQVYPDGIRHMRYGQVSEWNAPHGKIITRCAVNQRQIVVALSGKKLVYFKMDTNVIDGDLCEQFTSINLAKQKTIASDFGQTPNDVSKKLEVIRNRYAFWS